MAWFYVKKGMIDDETVGPLGDPQFFAEVEEGRHKPATLVNHVQHTQGQWVELKTVPVLVQHFKHGQARRKQEAQDQQKARQRDAETVAKQREIEAQRRREEHAVLAAQRQEEQAAMAARRGQEEAQRAFAAETQQVFDRYWMPSYLQAVWRVSVFLCVLAVGITFVATAMAVLFALTSEAGMMASTQEVLIFVLVVLVALLYLVGVRLTLETFAIIFDIRALLKKQEHLMQEQLSRDDSIGTGKV